LILLILSFFHFVISDSNLSESPVCYGAVFDAGSTSTKLSLFEWPCR